MRSLFDTRLNKAIEGLYPSLCTIQIVTTSVSASNQKVPTGATDIEGLINLRGRMAPMSAIGGITDKETRSGGIVSRVVERLLKLDGYYPQIDTRRMQAVVDGVVYQIRGVDSDSQHFNTRLRLEIVKP